MVIELINFVWCLSNAEISLFFIKYSITVSSNSIIYLVIHYSFFLKDFISLILGLLSRQIIIWFGFLLCDKDHFGNFDRLYFSILNYLIILSPFLKKVYLWYANCNTSIYVALEIKLFNESSFSKLIIDNFFLEFISIRSLENELGTKTRNAYIWNPQWILVGSSSLIYCVLLLKLFHSSLQNFWLEVLPNCILILNLIW